MQPFVSAGSGTRRLQQPKQRARDEEETFPAYVAVMPMSFLVSKDLLHLEYRRGASSIRFHLPPALLVQRGEVCTLEVPQIGEGPKQRQADDSDTQQVLTAARCNGRWKATTEAGLNL